MKPQPLSLSHLALCAGSLIAPSLFAQSIIETANESLDQEDPAAAFEAGELAPVLYDGELEDIGPQYLLLPGKPAHDWFRTLFDMQWFNSTNPTLADDSDRRSADLLVATAQFGLMTPEKTYFGGKTSLLSGYRYQYFEYGEITGQDTLINGSPVNTSDFKGHTFFADGVWNKEDWKATLGLRYTRLNNQTNGSNFYNETVLSWGLSRSFSVGQNALLTFAYDGAAFSTESAVGAIFFRDDLNDRLANALSARLIYRINSKLFLQPSVRLNYSDYDNTTGGREDLTTSAGATLSYYVNKDTVARIFASYQTRDSNGAGVADYSNIDAGIGGSFSFNF